MLLEVDLKGAFARQVSVMDLDVSNGAQVVETCSHLAPKAI